MVQVFWDEMDRQIWDWFFACAPDASQRSMAYIWMELLDLDDFEAGRLPVGHIARLDAGRRACLADQRSNGWVIYGNVVCHGLAWRLQRCSPSFSVRLYEAAAVSQRICVHR